MKYSIIVPVYNIEKYLKQCIESILSQSYKHFEVILVNDGSTDGSFLICEEYEKIDPRIRVINKENQGLVRARQTGFEVSTGEYIITIDGDDFVDKNYLTNIDKILTEFDVDIICFGYYRYFNDSQIQIAKNEVENGIYKGETLEVIKKNLLFNPESKFFNTGSIIYSIWSKVIKRQLYEKYQMAIPSNMKNGEDVAVVMPAIMSAKSLYISNTPYYYYRQTTNSMINSFRKDEYERYFVLFDYITDELSLDQRNKALYMYYLLKMQLIMSLSYFNNKTDFYTYFNNVYKLFVEYRLFQCLDGSDFNKKDAFIYKLIKRKCRWFLWVIGTRKRI